VKSLKPGSGGLPNSNREPIMSPIIAPIIGVIDL
jgi:hypothetical protein